MYGRVSGITEKRKKGMSKERVMDYLQDIKQDKIIIIISHDWEIAELCDKVVKI